MLHNTSWSEAQAALLNAVQPVGTEAIPLGACAGRVLGFDLTAANDVPPFDRSPYDGYALRAEDTANASQDHPVTLGITETVAAGSTPSNPVLPGQAAHIMTGAPIPTGADCVVMFEKTRFTDHTVTLTSPLQAGANIVRRGEDVRSGSLLAPRGTLIDAGLAGTLASLGMDRINVYRRPRIGLISTGSEVIEPGQPLKNGQIYNANRSSFTALLTNEGCQVCYLGLAGDEADPIAALIKAGLESCDAVILTGGVSVGDWDVTPEAMTLAGSTLLLRGVAMKPGMACCYGRAMGKLVLGLSGNPASSVTNFCVCVLPAIRALCGRCRPLPTPIRAVLRKGFSKKSPQERFLRGRLALEEGTVLFDAPKDQGNVVLSSTIGCHAFVRIPAGSPPVDAGTMLDGFIL